MMGLEELDPVWKYIIYKEVAERDKRKKSDVGKREPGKPKREIKKRPRYV